MHNVSTLFYALLGGSWKVGHPLSGQGQDGGAAVALLVHASVVQHCYLYDQATGAMSGTDWHRLVCTVSWCAGQSSRRTKITVVVQIDDAQK